MSSPISKAMEEAAQRIIKALGTGATNAVKDFYAETSKGLRTAATNTKNTDAANSRKFKGIDAG
ncbi:hypothetical protein LR394_41080, partial [Kineosporia babensis]